MNKNILNEIAKHFNINVNEIEKSDEHNEYYLLDQTIEVVSNLIALENEKCFDSFNIDDPFNDQIGAYKKLNNSLLYFKWM